MGRLVAGIGLVVALVMSCGGGETEKSRFDDDESSSQGAGTTTGVGGIGTTGPGGAGVGGAPTTTSTGPGGSPVTTSSSSGQVCNDPGPEPNDSPQQASFLGSIDDCDGSAASFSGVLDGNDVDWFFYEGTDAFGCLVNPNRTINADGQVRICKYVECVVGTAEFTCPANSSPDSVGGLSGCCAQGELGFDSGCAGTSDDVANVYLRIDKPSGFSCVNYSITFHY